MNLRQFLKRLQTGIAQGGRAGFRGIGRALEALTWLFVAAASSQSLGPYNNELARLADFGAVGLLLLVVAARGKGPIEPRQLLLSGGALLFWFAITVFNDHYVVWLSALAIACVGVQWARSATLDHGVDGNSQVRALLLFALLYLGWITVPGLWHKSIVLNRWISHSMNAWLGGEDITLGPSISGFWLWILSLCFVICEGWTSRRWVRPLIAGLWATLGWLAFMILINRPGWVTQKADGLANAQLLGFLMIVIATVFICGRRAPPETRGWPRLRWVSASLVGVLCLSSALLTRSGDFIKEHGKNILVYGKGYLDWKVPEFGEYGPFSGGMFGFMPKYLAMEGYRVTTFEDEIITLQALSGHDVLVLINLGKEQGKVWRKEEIEAIWTYVQEGGSLLILGDHTNVFGLQDCFNELLERVNIRFEFDAAYHCNEGWHNCIITNPHPMTANLTNWRGTGIAIGASLTIRPPAWPVVVGRYAFSDKGFEENVMGSYLGNYQYDKGEPIGDMVLVAATHYGRGKVLVFGDTSTFQNGAWFSDYHPFIHNVVTWLCSRSAVPSNGALCLSIWSVSLLSFVALLLLHQRGLAHTVASLGLPIGLFSGFLWVGYSMKAPRLEGDLVLFDYSHGPRVNTDAAELTGIGGFLTNLERNGYLSLMMERFDPELIRRSKVYSTVAPVVPFSRDEVRTLMNFMDEGGLVFIAAGYPEKAGLAPLLHEVGLDVANVPLGPVPLGQSMPVAETDPRFVDAYPIIVDESLTPERKNQVIRTTEPLYKYGDYILAVYQRHGKGGLVFVADTRYFSSGNIEGMEVGYRLGNILFIKHIVEHARKGG